MKGRNVIGALALGMAATGLALNEIHAGRNDAALAALRSRAIEADPEQDVPDGAAVHIVGQVTVVDPLRDPLFPVAVTALRLDRLVEMLQWQETVEGTGQDRTARHEMVWADHVIDSTRFLSRAPTNPGTLPIPRLRIRAQDARLGRWRLSAEVLDRLSANPVDPPDEASVEVLGIRLRRTGTGYQSGDPLASGIGDVRVRFATVPAGLITIVGAPRGGRIGPWSAPNSEPVLLAGLGDRSIAELARERALVDLPGLWGRRFAGGVAAFVGLGALWPSLRLSAPGIVRLLGGHRAGGPAIGALLLVAMAVAAGWLLFRTPVGWPWPSAL